MRGEREPAQTTAENDDATVKRPGPGSKTHEISVRRDWRPFCGTGTSGAVLFAYGQFAYGAIFGESRNCVVPRSGPIDLGYNCSSEYQ
jgi:hypothetical protein